MRNAGVPIEALIEYIRLFQMGDATFEAKVSASQGAIRAA